jgi:serine/threonine protein kinase/pSer/pThr/pTyr-binding forkhead associated (FHA) protein
VPFTVGDLIDGHYRVEQRFAGGMGFVYVVMDEVVRKRYAIKQLSELHAENETLRERFRREASTWLLLEYHPHIVQAHSYLHRPEGAMLILEYVDGPSLEALLRAEKRLQSTQVIAYAREFCAGMHHAHTRVIPDRGAGVLHRDIKPGNILISRTNHAKITDFGLAKIQGDHTLTSVGQFVGTVAYSSPEQLRASGDVSRASDVYSFGAVMYQMLSGYPPFRGSNPAELYHLIQETEPKPLTELVTDLSPDLSRLVMRCLAKDPARRVADFHDLDSAIADLAARLPASRSRACKTCGFSSVRQAVKCPVCGGVVDSPKAAKRSEKPGRTWKCVCGALVTASGASCPKCGRTRTDQAEPGSKPEATLPAPTQSDGAIPVLSDAPAAGESQSKWTLDTEKEYIVELRPGGQLVAWPLERTRYTLGRETNMKIRLSDPSVARYQLNLVRLPGGWLAINASTSSLVQVNGWPTSQRLLRPGDLVRVGKTWLTFSGPAPSHESPPPLPGRWSELTGPRVPTIKSDSGAPTRAETQTPTACVLQVAGGAKVVSRGQPIRIGTSPLCELRLNDDSAAPVQALIAWQTDGPHLINVTGGLVRLLGGQNVADRVLQDGDLLQIGITPVRVRIEGDPHAPARAHGSEPIAPRFAITVLSGDHRGHTAVLATGQSVTLGRQTDCEVVIPADSFVSRKHLQLVAGPAQIDITDVAGRSGFFLNQVHYPSTGVAHLGDVLVVGKTSLLVHHEVDP